MLATSKNVLFPGHNHLLTTNLLTTGADDDDDELCNVDEPLSFNVPDKHIALMCLCCPCCFLHIQYTVFLVQVQSSQK